MRRALVLAVTLGAAAAASAHVAPSVDDNNRYLKLTALGDRIRLAYVVFYGEVPGARLRPALDTDGDGAIGEAEADAFGGKLGAEIAAALDVTVDGAPRPIAWSLVSVGLGSPRVQGGSFSVDLVANLCLPAAAGGRHELRLRDRFRLPKPGETEVKIDDSPGIQLERARVGDRTDPEASFRFAGPAVELAGAGVELAFTAGDQALSPTDGACATASGGRGPRVRVLAVAAVLVCAAAGAALWATRRRRRA
jgi:hypothetical protein